MKAARLIVLGIAVSAGGLAAFLAGSIDRDPPPPPPAAAKLDTVDVLVAKSDIGIGQSLKDSDIGWQPWPAGGVGPAFLKRSENPDAVAQFVGAVARTPIAAGEPVRESKLIRVKGSGYMAAILPAGMRAVSTEISPETGAGGFILPNDRVDVLLTRRDRESERATGVESHVSETILTDVRVLAIDQMVEDKNGQKVVVGRTATLELTPRQAETLAVSKQMGSMSLALRSLADSDPTRDKPEVVDLDRTGNRVNMVRFGVTSTSIAK
ncbi:Flp pilus assembly protein CpaB [Rhodoplanes sp. SY1]|uniref:Flp pilus assembly protein CpaB n=1 Tax=Rhodoplanes sp. SY1 TaxID=3166646 RepID=UPI0038B44AF1